MGTAAGTGTNAAAAAGSPPERRAALDGTAYWTLSFYISRAQIEDHPLAMRLDPTDFGEQGNVQSRDALLERFSIERYFTEHPLWREDERPPPKQERKTLDTLRDCHPFDARARLRQFGENIPGGAATRRVQGAINPLFNDIADRSRLGRIEDQLFAAGTADKRCFVLPDHITWSTEGQTFAVPTDPTERAFPIRVTRFWYLHGNGSMSWHVSFDVHYRNDWFVAALEQQRMPHALYLLSLMQKLAYPKEKEVDRSADTCPAHNAEPQDPPRADKLFKLGIAEAGKEDKPELFWDVLKGWFGDDKQVMAEMFDKKPVDLDFGVLCPHVAINEIPGLFCLDTRSNFFIRDEQFFNLIQPKVKAGEHAGELVERRKRILDPQFTKYPRLVDADLSPKAAKRAALDGKPVILLDQDYWKEVLKPDRDPTGADDELPDAAERLLYLFLAGFNQNIIDWTNQEASEVLDSLDPIYPNSEEQLEEGFFIRYANPRCLITYVQRSRTLEVGNDFIGTCPYAFLIHVLAMHNERLTRDQEKLAFAVVEKVNSYVREAQGLLSKLSSEEEPQGQTAAAILRHVGKTVQDAEAWINWYRMAAFEHFDRHRYVNPFRYDTERDVFDELEMLRGTSRLEKALEKAFGALDESTRDLERVRAEAEREQERQDDRARASERELADAQERSRDRLMAVLFGVVGLSGVGQLAFNFHQFAKATNWQQMDTPDIALLAGEALIAIIGLFGAWWLLRRPALTASSGPASPAASTAAHSA